MPLNLDPEAQAQLITAFADERRYKQEVDEDVKDLEKRVADLEKEQERLRALNASLTTQLKKSRISEHRQKMAVASKVAGPLHSIIDDWRLADPNQSNSDKVEELSHFLEKYTFFVKFSDDMEVVALHQGFGTDTDIIVQLPVDS